MVAMAMLAIPTVVGIPLIVWHILRRLCVKILG